ncbi:hypothetical protein ZHAS_00006340 [Anopheles sinensis]|uniref:Uncharacterized protein n=1 Tax=Anopheles sinensis TaxID=74873 RepID=A0A084VLK7_ANOSI|nr:hypothetical protein ZHAS_00006340 [Anopheles sinensis]
MDGLVGGPAPSPVVSGRPPVHPVHLLPSGCQLQDRRMSTIASVNAERARAISNMRVQMN